MIKARFKVNPDDPRPVCWPIKHHYWITGYGEAYIIIVAYADDEDARQAPSFRAGEDVKSLRKRL